MLTRLTNFGFGGANLDQFEGMLLPNQWSRMDNVDINGDALESAGADIIRGDETPIVPKYMYLYEAGNLVFDVISDGTAVYVRSSAAEWQPILAGLSGGEVTYTVFRGCLVINSSTDGLYTWCQVYGNPFNTSWDEGYSGSWDSAYAPTWDDDEEDIALLDNWDDGPNTTWNDGEDIPWSGYGISSAVAYQGWPTGWTAQRVVAYKDQLVAVHVRGTPEGSAASPFLVYWSSLAPPGFLPSQWEPQVGNFAGYALVQDTSGQLVTGEVLRDNLILYKTDGSIWRMTATGDPTLPMVLERVLTDEGGIERVRNVCVAGEVHYLLGKRGFAMFDGNQVVYPDFLRVQDSILRTIADNTYEFIAVDYYGPRREIWVGYSGPNSEYLAGILKYSFQHNAFSIHEYPGKGLVSFACGREIEPDVEADTWDTGSEKTWNAIIPGDTWDGGPPLPTSEVAVLGFESQLAAYRHYFPPLYVDGTAKRCRLERYGLRFDEGDKTIVKALYPEMMKGVAEYELGWGWLPNIEDSGSVHWEPARSFNPLTQRKIPYRVIADAFAVRVISQERFTLAALTVEHETSARR